MRAFKNLGCFTIFVSGSRFPSLEGFCEAEETWWVLYTYHVLVMIIVSYYWARHLSNLVGEGRGWSVVSILLALHTAETGTSSSSVVTSIPGSLSSLSSWRERSKRRESLGSRLSVWVTFYIFVVMFCFVCAIYSWEVSTHHLLLVCSASWQISRFLELVLGKEAPLMEWD